MIAAHRLFYRVAYRTSLRTGIVVLAMASLTWAEEPTAKKTFTQVPEVMPSNVQADLPGEQKAEWSAGPVPSWIWGADNNKVYYARKTFTGGTQARLIAACDNSMHLFINGQSAATGDDWMNPIQADVQQFIKEGENTLLAEMHNSEGIAGFVLKLAITAADGKIGYVITDDTWEIAESRDAAQWTKPRIVAKYGADPWKQVFSGGGSSAAAHKFNLLPGFQVERLFTVPKNELGSWVCITQDDKGRIIASDQGDKGICRITPPPIGSKEPVKIERLDVKLSSAQGLLWAFGSLYASVHTNSGLYRLRATNGDDQFDEVVKLADLHGGGEHGPHALRLSPDGKSILVIAGNHSKLPFDRKLSSPVQTMGGIRSEPLHAELPAGVGSHLMPNWDEDLLLPRQWDANGHAVGVLAPGGWIMKTDPDCKTWELLSSGYRNEYDIAFNADGELFTYDADMEWDYGMPWYRPTRVMHATSGSEFGWRSGTGKWPAYYVDSLPPLLDIGPGSPVGIEFGYGAKFPAKYQQALYICDWTFGTMYAVHLEPAGATYKAVKEEFLSRTPLPLTDAVVGRDGALYFTVGGRGTQSELYRVTYVGSDSTAPVDAKQQAGSEVRALRRQIEEYHRDGKDAAQAADYLIPFLSHGDRFIRYAARVGLEHLPVAAWQDRVLSATNPETIITGVVGLARQGDAPLQPRLLAALGKFQLSQLGEPQQLELLRAYQLVLIRLGAPDDATREALAARFENWFPAGSDFVNRELANLMVATAAPNAAHKLVPYLEKDRVTVEQNLGDILGANPGYGNAVAAVQANQPDQQQVAYVFALRNLKTGWTPEERKTYFTWFEKAPNGAAAPAIRNFSPTSRPTPSTTPTTANAWSSNPTVGENRTRPPCSPSRPGQARPTLSTKSCNWPVAGCMAVISRTGSDRSPPHVASSATALAATAARPAPT